MIPVDGLLYSFVDEEAVVQLNAWLYEMQRVEHTEQAERFAL